MKGIVVPVILILLAIPMILEKVPRNGIYGFRTAYTLSSDAVWYRANRVSGFALAAAGAIWLLLAIGLPAITSASRAGQLAQWYGLASLGAAVAVSFWLTYRGR